MTEPAQAGERSALQRRAVFAIGLLAAVAAARPGYDIGARIGSPWLGVVMAVNLALMVGLLTSLLCDRLWNWLRRAGRSGL